MNDIPDNNSPDDEQEQKINLRIGGNVGGDVSIAGRDLIVDKSHNSENIRVINPFNVARQAINHAQLTPSSQEDATLAVDKLEALAKTENLDSNSLDRWLDMLEKVAPTVVEALLSAIANPAAAVGKGLAAAIEAWRLSRQSK